MRIPLLMSMVVVAIVSCKKNDKTLSANPNNEECVVGNSLQNGEIIEGQYIVAFQSPVTTDAVNGRSTGELSTTVLKRNKISSTALDASYNGGFVARLSKEEVVALRTDSRIRAIEPDRIVALGTCFTVVAPTLITWNVKQVGYGDGTGKTAWIIDSGIDLDHPDLNVDATRSRSFVSGEASADDENGHGTHVAGIIGAKNNTIGVLGIASGCNLVALKVLGQDGVGKLSYIIQALAYINANAKAGDVVNMSLGEDETSEILDDEVRTTAAKGIFIAIAAGNDKKPAIQFSPGRVNATNVYTVSAVDSLGNFASFSNYGNDAVDYAAPGVRIPSTYTGGRYARLSGTSMAAPHVAGLLLLNGGKINSKGVAKNDPDGTADPIAHQ